MRALRRTLRALVVLICLLALAFALYAFIRNRPQDLPWTPLDLGQPVGLFTGRKLTALTEDYPRCRLRLDRAGASYAEAPEVDGGDHCGYSDGVRLRARGSNTIRFAPADLTTSCSVAAAFLMWEWNTIQPAAQRIFGQRVETVQHFGSYSCRRMYGRDSGPWSEHATADALDVAGFELADGTRISVAGDWNGSGDKARFLHAVRDGACDLYATVLSPDYNAAHRDHLHLDQANRGAAGWRACR
ncbi:extensin-like domain-containing protein [Stakelama saccharophila]|uniref:Extensin family protein n=1 Tax=Stakelama saccharophila TaxID=3075605 RepID=A0ABZ0BAL5_9SPHN|nr:extensin family protein [Stakelama sp. W311]WNO54457.1 extensin family protein [Stakelama sp. W311]